MREALLNLISQGEYRRMKRQKEHYKQKYESHIDKQEVASICDRITKSDLSTLKDILNRFEPIYEARENNFSEIVDENIVSENFGKNPLGRKIENINKIINVCQTHLKDYSIIFIDVKSILTVTQALRLLQTHSKQKNIEFELDDSEMDTIQKIESILDEHYLNHELTLVTIPKEQIP